MKVIIAGSRHIEDRQALERTIADSGWDITEVVSGGCRGVDCMGEYWAHERAIPVRPFIADWGAHGRIAGELRNRAMAEYADGLILLWDGKSPGASCMLREATRAGIPVHAQIHGVDMNALADNERAILDYYRSGRGRLVERNGHWQWENADAGAPPVSTHAINDLIRHGYLEEAVVTVLQLAS